MLLIVVDILLGFRPSSLLIIMMVHSIPIDTNHIVNNNSYYNHHYHLLLLLQPTSITTISSTSKFNSNQYHQQKSSSTTITIPNINNNNNASTQVATFSSSSLLPSFTYSSTSIKAANELQQQQCNFTIYPIGGCNYLFNAICDKESNICLCNQEQTNQLQESSTNSNNINKNNNRKKNKNLTRHRRRYCLDSAKLGDICQSSGQCRIRVKNSACYMASSSSTFIDWRCACDDGFIPVKGVCGWVWV